MAICSESSSPRISFSHDLHKKDDSSQIENNPSRLDSSLLESNFDFNFCVSENLENETSSAEELFSDGLIRPLQLQERFVVSSKEKEKFSLSKPHSLSSLPPLPSSNENSKLEMIKLNSESDPKSQPKSFWGFKRSTSLHCENSHKKSSFWSLPLLSRSNSTGSVSNSKRSNSQSSLKDCQKQNLNKPKNFGLYAYPMSHKPPLKKNFGGYNGNNGVRISPVLNVPPPYISRGTANLFGLGSLFGNGKDRKNKK